MELEPAEFLGANLGTPVAFYYVCLGFLLLECGIDALSLCRLQRFDVDDVAGAVTELFSSRVDDNFSIPLAVGLLAALLL